MSTSSPVRPSAPAPGAPASVPERASARLGAAEAAIVIAAITAVTVLGVLERPVPTILAFLVSAAMILLLPGRAPRLLSALAELFGGRQ
ncbi:hypothetical protein [Streptomyces sp. NPDC058701]|uniref:hypothetical protein n=1 Tax=Streptomyces sp. NPDC058701 TaxID=3346608 RepID=UPI00364CD601